MKTSLQKFILILTLFITTALLVSCSTYVPFMAPGFTGEKLNRGGLAVFPVMVADGSQSIPGIQGYVRAAGGNLVASLRAGQPSLKVISPAQVSASLASNNLVADFAKLKQDYAITGIININLAKKIIKPLNVQYFMLPSVNSLFAPDKSTARAQMSGNIYDANSAEMVFEAVQSGDGTKLFGGPDYSKAIQVASENLARTLFMVYSQNETMQGQYNTTSQETNNYQEETTLDNSPPSNFSNNSVKQNGEDVVYLKDGQVLKGKIVNEVPNTSIDIKRDDGNTYYYRMDQIQKITKGSSNTTNNKQSNYSQSSNYSETSNRTMSTNYSKRLNTLFQTGKSYAGLSLGLSFTGSAVQLGANYEYAMEGGIGLGGIFRYWSYDDSFLSYTNILFGVQGNYHIKLSNSKVDPYVGVTLAYNAGSTSWNNNYWGNSGYFQNNSSSTGGLWVGVQGGARYWFSPNMAVHARLSVGTTSAIDLGVDMKF